MIWLFVFFFRVYLCVIQLNALLKISALSKALNYWLTENSLKICIVLPLKLKSALEWFMKNCWHYVQFFCFIAAEKFTAFQICFTFPLCQIFFLSTLKCKHWFSVFSIHSVICKSCGMCLNAIENIMPERSMVSASVFYQHNTVHVKSDSLIGAHNWKSVGIATAQFLKISCRLW